MGVLIMRGIDRYGSAGVSSPADKIADSVADFVGCGIAGGDGAARKHISDYSKVIIMQGKNFERSSQGIDQPQIDRHNTLARLEALEWLDLCT
jgi:hypothetical protein